MRLWSIQDLFNKIHEEMPKAKKHLNLIHVCSKCNWRTPEIRPLSIDLLEINVDHLNTFEIRNNGYCDKCNQEAWKIVHDSLDNDVDLIYD